MVQFVIGFLAGAVIGAAVALLVSYLRWRVGVRQLRESFAALAAEALDANAQRLGAQVGSQLETKKELIDQSVKAVNERLERVRQYLAAVEAERKEDFGKLSGSVASASTTRSSRTRPPSRAGLTSPSACPTA